MIKSVKGLFKKQRLGRKGLYLGVTIVIICQIIFLLGFYLSTTSQKAALERKYNFSNAKNIYRNLADQRLTEQEYKSEIAEMTTLITTKDPSVALTKFKEEIATNPKILAGCHELLHEIGRIAYKKYNNLSEAMQYRDEVCVGGYIHGVIEGYFGSNKLNFTNMANTCSAYPANSFTRWECFHGMGHGLMLYSANNVPESLLSCDSLPSVSDQQACYSGTYMENFNADTLYHPSKYLDLHNPFSLCEKDTRYTQECYLNAPFAFLNYYNNDYKGALAWCDEAPVNYRNNCYEGVGAQVTRREFHNLKTMESVCMSGGSSKVTSCISGAADWYVDHYVDKKKAIGMCNEFNNSNNRAICRESVENQSVSFVE